MLQRSLEVGVILESGGGGLETSLEEMGSIWLEVKWRGNTCCLLGNGDQRYKSVLELG